MKLISLAFLSVKNIIRNKSSCLLLFVTMLICLTGLILCSQINNSFQESDGFNIKVDINFIDTSSEKKVVNEIKHNKNIIKISYDKNTLTVKTPDKSNINIISNILKENKYENKVTSDADDYHPRFTQIVDNLSRITYYIFIVITLFILIFINLKKISGDSRNMTLLKCMGYKTSDIAFATGIELLIIGLFSFILSAIISKILICFLSPVINNYMTLKFSLSLSLFQLITLITDIIIVSTITLLRLRKIDLSEAIGWIYMRNLSISFKINMYEYNYW